MINKKIKAIPTFKSEDDERDFWANHDTTEYFDTRNPLVNPAFPSLKFSTVSISLRLPVNILDQLKMMSNKRDIPYQSFIKTILADRIKSEYAT